jgi:hypothetical protein
MENSLMTQFLSNFNQDFKPSEEFTDPVGKLRVSLPQSLIDTDFEYGAQLTKWENLAMTNNRPFAFNSAIPFKNFNNITMPVDSRVVTVNLNTTSRNITAVTLGTPSPGYVTYTTSVDHGFSIGEYCTITNLTTAYNGSYQIVEVSSPTTFAVANANTTPATDATGNVTSNFAPPNGSIITITDTLLKNADGTFTIETGGGTNQFTYYAKSENKSSITQIFDSNKTTIFSATPYTGARIGLAPTITNSGTLVTVTTTVPHGLSLGNEIVISGTTASTNAPNGAWTVATITSPTSFKCYVDDAPTGTIVATSASIYVRPQGTFAHRPFDGGMIFSTNSNSNNQQAVRQTRRYFRYQSGKGILWSSGSLLKPSFQLDELSCSGSVITIQTKESHNLLPGAEINIINATPEEYNGTYLVTTVLSYNRLQVTATEPLPAKASGRFYMTVSEWSGAVARLGLFDEQNGVFFEYNGSELSAVLRNSTYQLSGRVTATRGSNVVSQTTADFPTSFNNQVDPGDYVVIRGQSYKVLSIESDTSLTISPSYRGLTTGSAIISKTFERRFPQSEWNIDKMDGTGFSGYNIDLNRMQMFYIDYSWYGAGSIRWGVRGTNGDITYVHKIENNNLNLEAYMRSGNLPGRYEVNTIPVYTKISSTFSDSATTLNVADTSKFKDSGTLCIRDGSKIEFVNYSSKTSTTFAGITRAKSGNASVALTLASGSNTGTVASIGDLTNVQLGQRVISTSFQEGTFVTGISGSQITFSRAATSNNPTVAFAPMASTAQTFTYSATAPVIVELAYPEFSPTVSHWGTSVIMDGRYDDDKSLVFTYGQRQSVTVPPNDSRALFSIRLGPSVDNGTITEFGGREVVNRMQLILRSLGILSRSGTPGSTVPSRILIRAILNGTPATNRTWTDATGNVGGQANSSLAQIADYSGLDIPIFGGEVVAGFFVEGTNTLDLAQLRDLGNSVLGGGSSVINTEIYPDGPDVLTIVASNVGTEPSTLLGRISWTEAQA